MGHPRDTAAKQVEAFFTLQVPDALEVKYLLSDTDRQHHLFEQRLQRALRLYRCRG